MHRSPRLCGVSCGHRRHWRDKGSAAAKPCKKCPDGPAMTRAGAGGVPARSFRQGARFVRIFTILNVAQPVREHDYCACCMKPLPIGRVVARGFSLKCLCVAQWASGGHCSALFSSCATVSRFRSSESAVFKGCPLGWRLQSTESNTAFQLFPRVRVPRPGYRMTREPHNSRSEPLDGFATVLAKSRTVRGSEDIRVSAPYS